MAAQVFTISVQNSKRNRNICVLTAEKKQLDHTIVMCIVMRYLNIVTGSIRKQGYYQKKVANCLIFQFFIFKLYILDSRIGVKPFFVSLNT